MGDLNWKRRSEEPAREPVFMCMTGSTRMRMVALAKIGPRKERRQSQRKKVR